eukprot:2280302-Alexandrium_andersonii.AAC.1
MSFYGERGNVVGLALKQWHTAWRAPSSRPRPNAEEAKANSLARACAAGSVRARIPAFVRASLHPCVRPY